jgi:hypothetical protein
MAAAVESEDEAIGPSSEVPMESCLSFSCMVKRLTGFAVAGAVIILLAGPLLTLMAAIGVCVLVGFLVWLPLHTVFVGPHSTWKNACDGGRRWRGRAVGCCGMAGRHCRQVGTQMTEWVAGWLPVIGGMLREGTCGAILGVLAAVVAGLQESAAVATVLTGCLLGIVVGFNHARSRAR